MLAALLRSVVNNLRGTGRSAPQRPRGRRSVRSSSAALELPAAERRSYIDRQCDRDAGLRRELIDLLAASESDSLLDRPLDSLLKPLLADDTPTATAVADARFVLQYELLERVPGGGMGVIYRARDTRLQRVVALKFLPAGPQRRRARQVTVPARSARRRGARPRNVCTIHEIGETDDGQLFIAMPFYAGETVADRVRARSAAGGSRPSASHGRSRKGSRTRTSAASSIATSSRRT